MGSQHGRSGWGSHDRGSGWGVTMGSHEEGFRRRPSQDGGALPVMAALGAGQVPRGGRGIPARAEGAHMTRSRRCCGAGPCSGHAPRAPRSGESAAGPVLIRHRGGARLCGLAGFVSRSVGSECRAGRDLILRLPPGRCAGASAPHRLPSPAAAARTVAAAWPCFATPGPRPLAPATAGFAALAGSRCPAMPSNKSVSDAPIVQFTNCRILRDHQLQR